MKELEETLRDKATTELQQAIRYNQLIDSANDIAKQILTERNAKIPTPQTDAEEDSDGRRSRLGSWIILITVVVAVAAVLTAKTYWVPFVAIVIIPVVRHYCRRQ